MHCPLCNLNNSGPRAISRENRCLHNQLIGNSISPPRKSANYAIIIAQRIQTFHCATVLKKSTEPNYETATYNWCDHCNQPSVHAAVQDGLSHILFATKYKGTNSRYVDRYFIVGYYEIGWAAEVNGYTAIRAKNLCFTPIEHAYEITDERWRYIKRDSRTPRLLNLRQATQRVQGNLLDEILQHLDGHNCVPNYLLDVARLKAMYNPFEEVPQGRIFIINARIEHPTTTTKSAV